MGHLWQEAMEGACPRDMQLETSKPLEKLSRILNRAPDCVVPNRKGSLRDDRDLEGGRFVWNRS